MAMTASGRANAIYNAIQTANANFSKLSVSEKAELLTAIEIVWGSDGNGNGDLVYIQENAEADPGITLTTETSTVVAPSGGGSCSGTGTITGKASIA